MLHGAALFEQNGESLTGDASTVSVTTPQSCRLSFCTSLFFDYTHYEVRSIWTRTCKAIKMILCPAFISETLRGGCVQDNKGSIVLIFFSLTLLPSTLIFPSAPCHMWSGVSHVAMPHGSARWCFHSRPKQPGAEPNIGAH